MFRFFDMCSVQAKCQNLCQSSRCYDIERKAGMSNISVMVIQLSNTLLLSFLIQKRGPPIEIGGGGGGPLQDPLFFELCLNFLIKNIQFI